MSASTPVLELLAGSNMDLRPGDDGAGLLAFLVVAGLVVVCVFLYRSMRKQLGRIDVDRGAPPQQSLPRETGPASEPGPPVLPATDPAAEPEPPRGGPPAAT